MTDPDAPREILADDDDEARPRPTLGQRFRHRDFWLDEFCETPMDRDAVLIDEKHLAAYERAWLDIFEGREFKPDYLVSFVAVRARRRESLELTWFPNVSTRFHELTVSLPREAFVCCVRQPRYDGQPAIFVRSEWLKEFLRRKHSIFALVDAIGVKEAIRSGGFSHDRLIVLRSKVDEVAVKFSEVGFVTVADSVLLKSQWLPGNIETSQAYQYEPEVIVDAIAEIDLAFRDVLGLKTYAVVVQGTNEYYDDPLLHISESRNHISLNSLGAPLADLFEIDESARRAIRQGQHPPFDLYLDSRFLHSLDLESGFNRDALVTGSYQSKLASGAEHYYAVGLDTIQRSRRTRSSHS